MSDAQKRLLTWFLKASEAEVLDRFARLPEAQASEDGMWVYVPGKRPDRVLLVAHADTVRQKDRTVPGAENMLWLGDVAMMPHNDIFGYCKWGGKEMALGADDRVGCAAMYALHDGSHSVLITSGEESGLKGAYAAATALHDELGKHQFAIEIDRQGARQMVFYNVSTPEFETWILAQMTKFDPEGGAWVKQGGSSSDIRAVCRAVDICGVNLAAGYVDEHRADERFYLGAWKATYSAVETLLHQAELPAWKLPPLPPPKVQKQTGPVQSSYSRHMGLGDQGADDDWEGYGQFARQIGSGIYTPVQTEHTVGRRRMILHGGKELTLAATISYRKAVRIMLLVDKWLQKGDIPLDDALEVYTAVKERSSNFKLDGLEKASKSSGLTSKALQNLQIGNIVHCKHWCNDCGHRIWRHIRNAGPDCLAEVHATCPKHNKDPLSPVQDFKLIAWYNGQDAWVTPLPPTGDGTGGGKVVVYTPKEPCKCGHSRVVHGYGASHCLMSSCKCQLYQAAEVAVA